jgi:hypothetical protein
MNTFFACVESKNATPKTSLKKLKKKSTVIPYHVVNRATESFCEKVKFSSRYYKITFFSQQKIAKKYLCRMSSLCGVAARLEKKCVQHWSYCRIFPFLFFFFFGPNIEGEEKVGRDEKEGNE